MMSEILLVLPESLMRILTELLSAADKMCDESSSEEGKTGKVIENDRIFSWVRLLDNECAPLLLGWLAALRIHSVTVCRLLRQFAHYRTNRRRQVGRGVVVWGFRVSRCGAQNLLSFLFRLLGRAAGAVLRRYVRHVCTYGTDGGWSKPRRQRIPTS